MQKYLPPRPRKISSTTINFSFSEKSSPCSVCCHHAESCPSPCQVSTCLLSLTPVMTAEEPLDTSNREKSSKKKDLMIKSCRCAPVPSRVNSKDAEADGPCSMSLRNRPQRQVASKLMCWGLAEVYKPSPPFRNSVMTHSHQHRLAEA